MSIVSKGVKMEKTRFRFVGLFVVVWAITSLVMVEEGLAAAKKKAPAPVPIAAPVVISPLGEALSATALQEATFSDIQEKIAPVGEMLAVPLIPSRLNAPFTGTITWSLNTTCPGAFVVPKDQTGILYDYVSFTPAPTNVGLTCTIEASASDGYTSSTYPDKVKVRVIQPDTAPTSAANNILLTPEASLTVEGDLEPNSVIGAGNPWTSATIGDSHIGAAYNSIRARVVDALNNRSSVHVTYYRDETADLLYSLSDDTGQTWLRYPIPGEEAIFNLDDPVTYLGYVIAKGDGKAWWEDPVQDIQVGRDASLALDTTPAAVTFNPSGVPHMAHYDLVSGDLLHTWQSGSHVVFDIDTDLSGPDVATPVTVPDFTTEVVDSAGDVGLYTSIAVDAAGVIHISYRNQTNTALKYAKKSGGSWTVTQLDGGIGNSQGLGTSIATLGSGATGKVGIAYFDASYGNLVFKESTNGGASFGAAVVLDSTGDVGRNPSIAYDDLGNLGIAYWDATLVNGLANGNLKFIERRGATWQTPLVLDNGFHTDPGGTMDAVVGQYASLSYDHAGTENSPMITYHAADKSDFTKTSARYVERLRLDESPRGTNLPLLMNLPSAGARWVGVELKNSGETTDPSYTFGRFTSVFVDSGNHVFTAFQNLGAESVDQQKSFSGVPPPPSDDDDVDGPGNHKPEIAHIQNKVEHSINTAYGMTRDLEVYAYSRDIDLKNVGLPTQTGRDPVTLTCAVRYERRLTVGNGGTLPTSPTGWVAVGPYAGADKVNIDGVPYNGVGSDFGYCFPPAPKQDPYFCQYIQRNDSDGTKAAGKLVWKVTANVHTPSLDGDDVRHEIRFLAQSDYPEGHPKYQVKMRKDKEKIKLRTWRYYASGGGGGGGGSNLLNTIGREGPMWMEML